MKLFQQLINQIADTIKTEVGTIKTEVSSIKNEMGSIKTEVDSINERIKVGNIEQNQNTTITTPNTKKPTTTTTTTSTTTTSLTIPKNYKPSSEDNDDGYMSYGNDDYDDDNSGIGLNNSDDDLIKGLPTSNGDSINDTIEKEKEEKSKNISSIQQPTIASIKGKEEENQKKKKSSPSPTSSSTSTSTSKKNDGSENKRVSKNKKSPKTIEELRNDSELMKIDVYKRIVTEGTQPRFVSFVNSTPKIKPNGMADSNIKLYDVIIKDVNGKKLCRGCYKPPEWDEQDKRQNPQEYSGGEENDKDSGESEDN
ncbi:hypothetical protein ACTFIY_006084 [Dictyostelium cf. discoideum]